MSALDVACGYAARGIPTFPCTQDKRPLTVHGFHDASTDPSTHAAWFERWPGANLAIPTGTRSGVLVVDLDVKEGRDGRATLAGLEDRFGTLPATLVVETPSGGEHRWFVMPDVPIRNSAGRLAGEDVPGFDVRGEGGYVLVPPSRIEGRAYAWRERRRPAELPRAWVDVLAPRVREVTTAPAWTPSEGRERAAAGRYSAAALQREARELAGTPKGARNDRLWRAAAALGGLVHLGGIDVADIRTALAWACRQWRDRDDVKDAGTIDRALRFGLANPRSVDLSRRAA